MFRDNRRSIVSLPAIVLALFMTQATHADIWREQAKIVPDDLTDYLGFGASVALDCDTLLVGSFNGPYVHMYQGAGDTWQEIEKLPAPFTPSQFAAFGITIALDDGAGVVSSFHAGEEGGSLGASIYVPTTWGLAAVPLTVPRSKYPNSTFLGNLALKGNLAVVGSPGDNESGNLSGAVYLFENTGGDVARTRLAASVGGADGGFGHALALEGDRLVIGAPGDDCDTGATYVFEKDAGGWTQKTKFASGVTDSEFGTSVAFEGDAIVVGAPGEGSGRGAAYVYEKTGATWTQVERLTSPTSNVSMYFGGSVGIDDGYVVIGVLLDNETGDMSGAAYVYHDSGGAWTQVARLHSSDIEEGLYFGYDLAIEGDRMVVGRLGYEKNGAAYVFELEGDNADINGDGKVDGGDLALWQQGYDPLGTPAPGDANDDGKVDGGDLALWQQNYDPLGAGQNTWGMGDWNGDGKIDGGDLALWQQNYDPLGTGGLDGTQHVPEPATLGLLTLGAGLIAFVRRRIR